MMSINSLALEERKKKETEQEDDDYDNYDDKDELQNDIHYKKK